jgi:ferredoxin-NADP reductase
MKLARRETVAVGTEAFTFDYGSEPFPFIPGQAIDLFVRGGLKLGIIEHQHAFSIAGGGATAIQIATRMRDSQFKNALGELAIGDTVEVDGPWGDFVVPTMTTDIVCLAGGIGVTPFRAMAQQMVAQSRPIDAALLHANRTPEETPFLAELKRWSSTYPRFNYVPIMSQLAKSNDPHYLGLSGRIDAAFLDEMLDEKRDQALYMVAGPEGFVRAMAAALAEIGVPKERVMTEEFPGYAR